ncbi:YlxM family DNA-binding protein [Desulfitobacterium sp.]|uniref:YlxM family DNA-binding protein n=1 Tax=Desulfitobacterium sp. TaxID=49981 RepID=UPI002BB1A3A1|nr:YlxM family DNA-binding protein [Desulfitobacterium sp.]HVJ47902.1 YlxM family DNA-binding protein [Desulfitobacterium sp.]
MERFAEMALLADFYGPLLTEKQRNVWDLHYEQDLSLVEIATAEKISRQAVYDLLKRTEKILSEYEAKLGLIHRFLLEQEKLIEVKKQLQVYTEADFTNLEAWERHQMIRGQINDVSNDMESS